jgi:hypothetical protein
LVDASGRAAGLAPGAGGRAWLGVAALLGLGSLVAWWLPAWVLDWQPGLLARQPWRIFSAAWVHWSAAHLAANVAAAAVVGAFGAVARLPGRAAAAWLLAWPITHLPLGMQPGLAHYGGASGVVHAGVAVAAVWLVWRCVGRARAIGLAVLGGLALKVVAEEPWKLAFARAAWLDIGTVPLVHAAGAAAGTALAAALLVAQGRGVAPPGQSAP